MQICCEKCRKKGDHHTLDVPETINTWLCNDCYNLWNQELECFKIKFLCDEFYHWDDFLKARSKVIMKFSRNGNLDKEIASTLSMDETQVRLIREHMEKENVDS